MPQINMNVLNLGGYIGYQLTSKQDIPSSSELGKAYYDLVKGI